MFMLNKTKEFLRIKKTCLTLITKTKLMSFYGYSQLCLYLIKTHYY